MLQHLTLGPRGLLFCWWYVMPGTGRKWVTITVPSCSTFPWRPWPWVLRGVTIYYACIYLHTSKHQKRGSWDKTYKKWEDQFTLRWWERRIAFLLTVMQWCSHLSLQAQRVRLGKCTRKPGLYSYAEGLPKNSLPWLDRWSLLRRESAGFKSDDMFVHCTHGAWSCILQRTLPPKPLPPQDRHVLRVKSQQKQAKISTRLLTRYPFTIAV